LFLSCGKEPKPAEAQAQVTPARIIASKPIRKSKPKIKAKKTAEALVLETPTPDNVGLEAAPTLALSPVPRKEASVLESVAFKDEEEVLSALGEPDEQYDWGGYRSWYYQKEAVSRKGRKVCPEVQFFEDEARFVIMWPPETMAEKIKQARRLKAEGKGPGKEAQTFTFTNGFKYLGVGTPQETVQTDLGEPDAKRTVEGKEEWDYDTLVVENGASRRLTVVFKGGKVTEVRGR
jgi:hypothetical protein